MGRTPNPDAKAELLEGIVEYLLRGGLQDLSLRPLAEALGTNARMLLYYFGSKENLVVEALTAAQARQQAVLQNQPPSSGDPTEGLRRFWGWFTSPELAPACSTRSRCWRSTAMLNIKTLPGRRSTAGWRLSSRVCRSPLRKPA